MKNRLKRLMLGALLLAVPALAQAGDRHFIYNYESGVLGAGVS